MYDSLLGFRDEEERNEFLIALPVLAFFGCMLYYFVFGGDQWVSARLAQFSDSTAESANLTLDSIADLDQDGISDSEDHCTSKAGSITAFGCPEDATTESSKDISRESEPTTEQNDCLIDGTDNIGGNAIDGRAKSHSTTCAEEPYKPAVNDPLPADTDSDGIEDSADLGPNLKGKAENGCPDTDTDGISNNDDLCPNVAGLPDNNGCPAPVDSDSDGVPDPVDLCPQQAGTVANNGCPADTDEDGLSDANDQCPEQPGSADHQGCPAIPEADTDGDGVADANDRCLSVAGISENDGCPADEDRDGIPDSEDRCPNVVGLLDYAGCQRPEGDESTALLNLGSGISFEPASATLTGESQNLLSAVARALQRYPGINLHIDGHTDSQGSAAINQQLSEQRARACVNFLIQSGIESVRLSSSGYGENKPIADNATSAGRRQNRRVEFSLSN